MEKAARLLGEGVLLPMTWGWTIDEEKGLPREEVERWRLQEGEEG